MLACRKDTILRTLTPEDFQRQGIHSEAGPLTLEAFVQRSTRHIPHHVRSIEEKRKVPVLVAVILGILGIVMAVYLILIGGA